MEKLNKGQTESPNLHVRLILAFTWKSIQTFYHNVVNSHEFPLQNKILFPCGDIPDNPLCRVRPILNIPWKSIHPFIHHGNSDTKQQR